MILDRWIKVEDSYDAQDELRYSRTTKSLGRLLYMFMDPEERTLYDKLNKQEAEQEDTVRFDGKKSKEVKEKEIRDTVFLYADLRMKFLVLILANSPIVQRDLEVDFKLPKDEEGIKKVRDMIQEDLAIAEGGQRVRAR